MRWNRAWKPQLRQTWRWGKCSLTIDLWWTLVVWFALAGLALALWIGDWRIVL